MNTINICDELHQNFIDYAYETNSQRSFADARDGLKPGQRACLWEMYTKGYTSNKPHMKSATISGGVIGSWWPHGDVSVYDTFARMSQKWINNIPEVDWHGLNGNMIIGNAPAADRYTEARLASAIEEGMLAGIKKGTVKMIPNFSEDKEWPEVLPALMPRLLINGCQGIGVTIANHWSPHNLKEVSDVIINYIKEQKLDYSNLYPDFPTGGTIINKNEIHTIYETGKGKIVLRGKAEISGKSILITELPYQVFVEPLITSIKELITSEEITGIKDIYNKSDKTRLLVEIVCDNPGAVLNLLYAKTDLQKSLNPNQFALVGKTPKLLNLKEYLDIYIKHNIDCIKKEHEYDLNKAKDKLEIVTGLIKALEDIDNIIKVIKESKSSADAIVDLRAAYGFTERQAKAIVDMRLGRLANLERVELNKEKEDLISEIEKLTELLSNDSNVADVFINRLQAFTKKYGTERKTIVSQVNISKEDKEIQFVEPEKCVVIMTKSGLIKRIPSASFRTQKRNGKGVKTQDDITVATIRTNTVDSLMVFTNKGKMYRLLVNDIPVGTNATKGVSIETLITFETGESASVIYSIYRDTQAKFVLFVTKNGLIKKTSLAEYLQTKKKNGLAAINLKENDELVSVFLVDQEQVIILTQQGYAIRFNSTDVSTTSRCTSGVKGITLGKDDIVTAAMAVRDASDDLAVFSSAGIGKRVPLKELVTQNRGGKGLICMKPTAASGYLAAGTLVEDEDNVLISGNTSSICISAKDIPIYGRAALGNQIIKGNKILSVSKV